MATAYPSSSFWEKEYWAYAKVEVVNREET
jgi:hypothetical protein